MNLECQSHLQFVCRYNISNSTFINNHALLEGGVMKYTSYEPNVTNCNFTNNSALYGSNVAAFPVTQRFSP